MRRKPPEAKPRRLLEEPLVLLAWLAALVGLIGVVVVDRFGPPYVEHPAERSNTQPNDRTPSRTPEPVELPELVLEPRPGEWVRGVEQYARAYATPHPLVVLITSPQCGEPCARAKQGLAGLNIAKYVLVELDSAAAWEGDQDVDSVFRGGGVTPLVFVVPVDRRKPPINVTQRVLECVLPE